MLICTSNCHPRVYPSCCLSSVFELVFKLKELDSMSVSHNCMLQTFYFVADLCCKSYHSVTFLSITTLSNMTQNWNLTFWGWTSFLTNHITSELLPFIRISHLSYNCFRCLMWVESWGESLLSLLSTLATLMLISWWVAGCVLFSEY